MLLYSWIKRSFIRQIIFVLFSIMSLVSVLSMVMFYYDEKNELEHIVETQSLKLIDGIVISIHNDVRYNNYYKIYTHISNIYNNNNNLSSTKGDLFKILDITIVDLDNKVISHTNPKEYPIQLKYKNINKMELLFKNKEGTQFVWNDTHTKLHLKSNILFASEVIGTVYINANATSLIKKETILLRNILYLLFILIILLFILVFLFGKWIERPLHNIIKELDKLGDGIITFPLLLNRKDEFFSIAKSIMEADERIYLQKKDLFEIQANLKNKVKQEITKNRETEKYMLHQSRLAQMGELLSMIAHQWRQPLALINVIIFTIKMRLDLNEFDLDKKSGQEELILFTNEQLDIIEETTGGLSTIIDDFKDFYKPSKEKAVIKLNEPVNKAISMVKASFEKNMITLRETYEDTPKVSIYTNELTHVILNLLQNSMDELIEHKVQNPKITIKNFSNDSTVILEISDNGEGIDEETAKKIFDPYFSTKESKNGTGLGLYMSKVIIENHHNGKLFLKDDNIQTCFVISLPIYK